MSKPLEFLIEDVGAQGDGIARHDGKTVFVPGALTGERVAVVMEGERAVLQHIVQPGAQRVRPSCAHFPSCGGCRMQHFAPDAYSQWKHAQLAHMLRQNGLSDVEVAPVSVSAPRTRRRARLAAQNKKGKIIIGFNRWRSHDLVDLLECDVLTPELTALVQKLREHLGLWLRGGQTCDVQITQLPDGIDVLLVGGPELGLDQRLDLADLASRLNIAQLSWRKSDRAPVEPIMHVTPLHKTFGMSAVPFPPGSFLQATTDGEKALIDYARAHMHGDKVLDLFCGLGGFGLSTDASHVAFADVDGPAIEALSRFVKVAPRGKNYHVKKRDLMRDPFTAVECNEFDTIIFDPPRGGAKVQSEKIADSKVRNIVAISCDPVSFVRDTKILIEGGYRLGKIQPVDQFLWSTHLELAAHFTR